MSADETSARGAPRGRRSADDRRLAQRRGHEAEDLVTERLQADGWRVRARNWRGGGAELDLVVERAGCLRFVEVKARDPGDDGALEAITHDKRRRLARGAEAWLAEHGAPAVEAAFLIAVVTTGEPWSVEWLDDAFDV